jgi:hexokinase
MNITWVPSFPTGHETGRYITIDMGGTNLRICSVELTSERGGYSITQDKYILPNALKRGTGDELWELTAEKLLDFLRKHDILSLAKPEGESGEGEGGRLPLAFTFSYPVTQEHIRHGVLQRWTKGFDIRGVEGEDVVAQLDAALQRRHIPVSIVALVNDTVGTLIASAYKNPDIRVGSIFGTGCNAAYMERCSQIPKIPSSSASQIQFNEDSLVAINCEYGAFDNSRRVLPRTEFDEDIDATSARPGQQTYEKMVAAMYLGELLRLIPLHLHESVGLFPDADVSRLREGGTMDAVSLSKIEADGSEAVRMEEANRILHDAFGIDATDEELRVCCILAEVVCARAARLYACGIAALCRKQGVSECAVGVDGSAFEKYSQFRERAVAALAEILDWPENEERVKLVSAEDGSGVGAALIAAIILNQ